jgi:hypothetical protein
MERVTLAYPSHFAFYAEDPARVASSEQAFGEDWDGHHLSYVLATGELYLGEKAGGPLEVIALFEPGTDACERLLAGEVEGDALTWLWARLAPALPGPRTRKSPLAA